MILVHLMEGTFLPLTALYRQQLQGGFASMKKQGFAVTGLALGAVLTGCGLSGAASPTPTPHSSVAPTSSSASTTARVPSSQTISIQWTRLPLRTMLGSSTLIEKISPNGGGSGLDLQVGTYRGANFAKPTLHQVSWQIGSRSVKSIATGTASTSSPASVYRLVTTNYTKVTPQLMDGNTAASVKWPSAIPVYLSGANPFGQPFQVDNKVIGQSGSWIWVALKGPSHPTNNLLPLVWGFRHWERLVALNVTTGQYRIFGLPWPHSENLAYPLWDQAPAFAANHDRVYIGIGDWIGEFPTNPVMAGNPHYQGEPSSTLTTSRVHRALNVLNQASWNAVNADAQFWNCYVMKDKSAGACPSGNGFPTSNALSQSPTYFNHGDVGPSILWANELPMPSQDVALRTAAMVRLQQGLHASLFMEWVGNPSAKAIRQKYSSGPPQPLPGYYRKNHLYWAKS